MRSWMAIASCGVPFQFCRYKAGIIVSVVDLKRFFFKDECMRPKYQVKTGSLAGLMILFLFPLSASAAIDCATLPHWVTLKNGLQMNQKHIFCGEWKDNRPQASIRVLGEPTLQL